MAENPFLTRIEKAKTQSKAYRRSPKQEKDLSKRLGAQRMSGSGAGFSTLNVNKKSRPHKGDLRVSGVARIEAKTTSADSFRVTKEMIDKITNVGLAQDEVPAIVIEFLDKLGKPVSEVAVIPMWALQALLAGSEKP